MQYIFTSKANKGKSPCVTNFTCILLENQGHAAVCLSVSSKCVLKNTFLWSIFAEFLVVFDFFGYMESLMKNIQKSPSQSLKKTQVTIFIKAFISAYDSTA